MDWTDIYLRFETVDTFEANMPPELREPSPSMACDVVGYLDESAFYHVNLRVRGPLPAALMPYVIAAPLHPKRCFM